jgi:acyl carrier protein
MLNRRDAILAEVGDIFRSVLEDPLLEITLQTTTDDVSGWDSMRHIAIVVEAECRFDIQFRTHEIEYLTNVGELVQLIEAKCSLTLA